MIKRLACGILKIAFEDLEKEKGLKRMLMESENERINKNQFENIESKSDNDDNLFESDNESMSKEKEKIEKDQMKFCKLYVNGRVYNEQLKERK